MHTNLNCDSSNFESDLQHVAIMRSIQTDEILAFSEEPNFCVLYISITNKVQT